MEWRSHEVEKILGESQEYLVPPAAQARVGFFRSLTLLPQVIGLRRNPDGAVLKDIIAPEVYARWLVLKAKYLGEDSGIEKDRPIFAAGDLFRAGLIKTGLSPRDQAVEAIEKLAKKRNLKITETAIKLAIDDPSKMMKDFKKGSLDDSVCFAQTLERLETDLDAMRVRANAWAKGDIAAIQKLSFADQESACAQAMRGGSFLKDRPNFNNAATDMRNAWLAAAEKSLEANRSTFAVLRMNDILKPNGFLKALADKGYTVEQPD